MRKKFQEGGEVKPIRRASRLSGPLGKVGKFGVATGLIPGMASNMLADVYGQAREAALGPFEEEGLKALAEERQRRQTARALPTMTPNYEEEMAAAEPTKRRSKPPPTRQRQYKKGGPVKKYEGGGMVEIEIKIGGGGKKGKHMMPDGSMMEDSEHESEEYKKGGRVKKYAEGGEVSPRSGMKAQLQRSRTRTQGLMETPENYLAPRDTTPIRVKPRSMFSTSRESDPIRQREREQTRREQDFRNRVNSAIEREYATQSELESQLDKDQEQSRPKNYKKGGAVKGGKWIQNAIKKPGALRAQLGVKEGQKIPAKKLATAAKAPGKLGQRARFAQTLSKMRKK